MLACTMAPGLAWRRKGWWEISVLGNAVVCGIEEQCGYCKQGRKCQSAALAVVAANRVRTSPPGPFPRVPTSRATAEYREDDDAVDAALAQRSRGSWKSPQRCRRVQKQRRPQRSIHICRRRGCRRRGARASQAVGSHLEVDLLAQAGAPAKEDSNDTEAVSGVGESAAEGEQCRTPKRRRKCLGTAALAEASTDVPARSGTSREVSPGEAACRSADAACRK